MENKTEIAKLNKRYARLAARLGRTGLVLQGTITERFIETDKNGQTATTGPYYQWTFKRHAKTVTVNLSPAQIKQFQEAIDNNKVLEQTLKEMRELSRQILDATTEGVKRRKPK